jgi:hypothetical protein
MATDISGDFTSTSGVPHKRGIVEIKRFDHGCKIVGIAIHVVPRRGLT